MQRNSNPSGFLEMNNKQLSEEQIAQGWHNCPDWDDLLIGPGMVEMQYCICKVNKQLHNKTYEHPSIEELLSLKCKYE